MGTDDKAKIGLRDTGQKLKKDQRARAEMFKQRLDLAQRAQATKRKEWERWDKVYHGTCELPAKLKEMLDTDLRINWCWQQGQNIWPRIMDPDPRIDFNPITTSDKKTQLADACKLLVKQQFAADNIALRQLDFIEDAGVRMLGVGKVIWLQRSECCEMWCLPGDVLETDKVISSVPENDRGYILIEREQIIENRPTLAYIASEDYMADPAATDDQNKQYEFQRLWLTMSELEKREQQGLYSGVKFIKGSSEDDQTQERGSETKEEAEARREGKFAVYEGWMLDDGTRMVMCEDVLLLDGRNPYRHRRSPFVSFCTQPNPRSMYGTSEMDKLEQLQYATWTKDNQRVAAVNAALNFVMIVDPNLPGGVPKKVVPGQVIKATMGQRVEQFQIGAQAGLAFQETENYLGAMQQMSGVTPLLSGTGAPNPTASGSNIEQEEGNKRMMVKKLQFRLFMARVAKLFIQLDHQYLSDFELARILDQEGAAFKISPEEIPMFLDVVPEAMTESLGEQAERNGLIELINILGQLHGTQMLDGTYFDMKPVVQDVLKSYHRNADTSFKRADQVKAAQAPAAPGGSGPTQSVAPSLDEQTTHGGNIQ